MQFVHFHAISWSWYLCGTNMIADCMVLNFIDFSVKTTKQKVVHILTFTKFYMKTTSKEVAQHAWINFTNFSVKATSNKLYSHFYEILRENNFKGSCINQFHEIFCKNNNKKKLYSHFHEILRENNLKEVVHVEKRQNSHRKNISSNQLFSDFISKNVAFTKFLPKDVRVNFRDFHYDFLFHY